METVVYLKVPAFPAGPLFRGSAFCQVQGSNVVTDFIYVILMVSFFESQLETTKIYENVSDVNAGHDNVYKYKYRFRN